VAVVVELVVVELVVVVVELEPSTSHPNPTVPQHHSFLSAGQLVTQSEKPSLQSRLPEEAPLVLEVAVVEASVMGGSGQPNAKLSQHQFRLDLDHVSCQFESLVSQSNAVVVDFESQPKPAPWEQHQIFFSCDQAASQFEAAASQSNSSVADVAVLVGVVATVSLSYSSVANVTVLVMVVLFEGQPTPMWEQHQVLLSSDHVTAIMW